MPGANGTHMLYRREAQTAGLAALIQLASEAAMEVICISWAQDTWGQDEYYQWVAEY